MRVMDVGEVVRVKLAAGEGGVKVRVMIRDLVRLPGH